MLEEMKNRRGGHLAGIGQQVRLLDNDVRQVVGKTGAAARVKGSLKPSGWNELMKDTATTKP